MASTLLRAALSNHVRCGSTGNSTTPSMVEVLMCLMLEKYNASVLLSSVLKIICVASSSAGSVERTLTVRKVVLTSSVSAVYSDADERGRNHIFNELDWNTTASASSLPYFYSKTCAEKHAWSCANKQTRQVSSRMLTLTS